MIFNPTSLDLTVHKKYFKMFMILSPLLEQNIAINVYERPNCSSHPSRSFSLFPSIFEQNSLKHSAFFLFHRASK
jgi:hypothetical protein